MTKTRKWPSGRDFTPSFLPSRIERAADEAMRNVLAADAAHGEALLLDRLLSGSK